MLITNDDKDVLVTIFQNEHVLAVTYEIANGASIDEAMKKPFSDTFPDLLEFLQELANSKKSTKTLHLTQKFLTSLRRRQE